MPLIRQGKLAALAGRSILLAGPGEHPWIQLIRESLLLANTVYERNIQIQVYSAADSDILEKTFDYGVFLDPQMVTKARVSKGVLLCAREEAENLRQDSLAEILCNGILVAGQAVPSCETSSETRYFTDLLSLLYAVLQKGQMGVRYEVGSTYSEIGYEPDLSPEESRYIYEQSLIPGKRRFYFENIHDGKLRQIQQLLLYILLEIDRVCKEYEIPYYLGGGTLLGAVRHQGFIPWDDDADIMMTRENFERFAEVAPKALRAEFFYQSPKTDPGYHEPFHKVRLRDTVYTTAFSDQFDMQKGFFIDIFAHDRTANSRWGQKLHVFMTLWTRSMVFHKWGNTPMQFYGRHERLCRILTRCIRHVPLSVLESLRDRVLTLFKGKSRKRYFYDGTGEHLRHGAFPAAWLADSMEMPFEGFMAPVPVRYDEYLTYSYDSQYMEWVPASQRRAKHEIIRMDMGKYEYLDLPNTLKEKD